MVESRRDGWRVTDLVVALVVLSSASPASAAAGGWTPAPAPLLTRWARDVSPERARPEYPRPQMVRREWLNLNGRWDFAIDQKGCWSSTEEVRWQDSICVPYSPETGASGVCFRSVC